MSPIPPPRNIEPSQYSDAPEVVPAFGLEPVPDSSLEIYTSTTPGEGDNRVETSAPEVLPESGLEPIGEGDETATTGAKRFWPVARTSQRTQWFKRKVFLVPVWLFILLVIVSGVVVGCVVGLVVKKHQKSPSPKPSGVPDPSQRACRDSICPQIFGAGMVASPSQLFVFGVGKNGGISYLNGTQEGWASSWTSAGGSSSSQPSAITWNANSRLDIFYVSSLRRNVMTKFYNNGVWSSWEDLGASISGSVSLCKLTQTIWGVGDRIDQWAISTATGEVLHNLYDGKSGDFYSPALNSTWLGLDQQGAIGAKPAAAVPAVACRDNPDGVHDILIYARNSRSVQMNQYVITKGGLQGWVDLGGNFIGDPVLLETGPQRLDFFGIGIDKAMYHFSWKNSTENSTGYSPLESLGGSFESVPSAVVTGAERIDVLALGSDGKLKHRTLIGTAWSEGWEDLHVDGNSAPLLTNLRNGSVGIFLLGPDSRLRYTHWEATDTRSWTSLIWRDLGGDIKADGYSRV